MARKFISLTFIALLLFITALSSISCNTKKETSSADNKKESLKIAYRDANIDYGILTKTAENKGFFNDNNLDVEIMTVEKNIVDKFVISGKVDAGLQAVPPTMFAYLDNLPTKSIGVMFDYDPFRVIISRYPLSRISEVKTVGAPTGGVGLMFTKVALKKMGINDETVKFVDTGKLYAAAIAMIKSGKVDLISVSEVGVVEGLDKKSGLFVFSKEDVDASLPKALVTSDKTLKEKPEALKRLLKSLYMSMKYVKDNKKDTIDLIVSEYEVPKDQAETMYDNLCSSFNYTLKIREADLDDYLGPVVKINNPSNPDKDIKGFFDNGLADQVLKDFK